MVVPAPRPTYEFTDEAIKLQLLLPTASTTVATSVVSIARAAACPRTRRRRPGGRLVGASVGGGSPGGRRRAGRARAAG